MAVQKKQETKTEKPEVKKEIIADDVVVKTTGNVEIIEEAPKEPARNASQPARNDLRSVSGESDAGGVKEETK